MSNTNGNSNSKIVITDEREVRAGDLKIQLRKPQDSEDYKNNIIFVNIFEKSPTLGEDRFVATTKAIVKDSPVDLFPGMITNDGKREPDPRYPKALKSGPLREAVEAAISKALDARVTVESPMSGTIAETEEA